MRLAATVVAIFFLSYSAQAAAWSKAIWPFNTPYMVAKQICTNAEGWAKSAVQSRGYGGQAELMRELRNTQELEIRDDPKYKEWHAIYYGEMTKFVRLVWKNPNVTEDMAVEMVARDCNSRINSIQKRLENADPD
ncbi:MAG: hypothetical protein IPH23_08435 [Gammaproteobacteria bacterium]|nr:hypothetical protein [Gammaproteobacteria bacterium]MBK8132384.1 hypothetical protein [Gammaproteobacteria bacterium]